MYRVCTFSNKCSHNVHLKEQPRRGERGKHQNTQSIVFFLLKMMQIKDLGKQKHFRKKEGCLALSLSSLLLTSKKGYEKFTDVNL